MIAILALPEHLSACSSEQVINAWAETVCQVRECGSIAVMNHSAVEIVMMDTYAYRSLVEASDLGSHRPDRAREGL